MASSTTSSSTGCESRNNDESSEIDGVSGSTMTSVELEPPESTAEEEQEENMAYCLMLLSQGEPTKQSEPSSSYVHLCKTCNRRFRHSRRSVGGQRACHKKPKVHHEKSTKGLLKFVREDDYMISGVHECWICGSEFSSGQALGGNMRRHRTPTTTTTTWAVGTNTEYLSSMKPTTVLQLDLNLQAPQDEQLLLFSASSLVDCP